MTTIWNFPSGARGLRAVWLCEAMGLPYKVESVTYPPSEAYKALNPIGSVPFLQDGDIGINESVAIMIYIVGKYGPTPLAPAPDDPRYARVLQMTVFAEATIMAAMNPLMGAHFAAPENEKRNWSVVAAEQQLAAAFDYAIGILGDGPFFAGAEFTMADIAMSTAFGIYRGVLRGKLPAPLAAFQDRIGDRPAYPRARERNGRR